MEKKESAPFIVYAQRPVDEIVEQLGTSRSHGLSTEQVNERLALYGRNEKKEHPTYWYHILFRQISSIFIGLFFVIAAFFFVLGEQINALIVLLLVCLNVGVGFYQEFRASKTIQLLKKYIQGVATVIRNHTKEVVDTVLLVPGDIVLLKAGDIVPADMRIIEESDFMVDESVLTGESVPLKKVSQILSDGEPDLFKAFNIAFTGTTVVKGKAKAVVFGTGETTTFGSMFTKTYSKWRESTLEKGVVQLSTFVIKLTLLTLILVVAANIIIKGPQSANLVEIILFATALMVTAIPEALPIVVTFNLSRAVRKLLQHNVIVKRLSAVEDLGALDILCVDKTGTLTENTLELAEVYSDDQAGMLFHLGLTLLPESVKNVKGFDSAIETYVEHTDVALLHSVRSDYVYLDLVPFDPGKRRTLLLAEKKDRSEFIFLTRGSYEEVAATCVEIPNRDRVERWAYDEGLKGRRVIILASKKMTKVPASLLDEEHDFIFRGMLSFVDPVKKTAKEALRQARELGVSIKVISGDAPEVCGAVAYELGLIDNPQQVMTGAQLAKISDADWDACVQETRVFARVLPDQKSAIIQSLQHKHTVGYMGDGLNDLAALAVADVALVVQGCSDVVRESGDIILTHKSLMSIIQGIREGRIILANTMKYIKTTLSANFGNFYAVALASLLVDMLPMLPIQILLLNFLSDFPMLALATDSVDAYEISKPRRYDIKSILFIAVILGIVSTITDFSCFAYFHRFNPVILQSGWFVVSALTEIAFIFSIRSVLLFYKAERPSMVLVSCGLLAALVSVALPFMAFGQRVFHFRPLDSASLIFIGGLVVTYFVITELVKYAYYYRTNGK